MAKDNRLSTVTYSRSYQAEKELPALIVGTTRWAQDLELLLEDKWPNLLHVRLGDDVSEVASRSGVRSVLIEGIHEVDRTKACIESHLVSVSKKVILLKESDNPFLKRTYLNYAARAGHSAIELPDNIEAAASELSPMLAAILGQARTEIEADIDKAELIVDGFEISDNVVDLRYRLWSERAETVVAWLFPLVTLGTTEYKLLKLLTRAQPMLTKQNVWGHAIAEIMIPLLTFAQSTKVATYRDVTLALTHSIPVSGRPDKTRLEEVLRASKLGVLTRRALTKALDALVLSGLASSRERKVS